MSKICVITGKAVITGNNVSKSKRRTRRTFEPNLHDKRFFIPSEAKWVKLRVSANGIRIINKLGVEEAMKRAKAKGFLN